MTRRRQFEFFAELTRIRLSLFVALSAATGYAAVVYRLSWNVFLPSLGCLLLAAGCSTLNQYQERGLDARMTRTRARPIPTGRVSPKFALGLSALLIGTALPVLWVGCGPLAALLGMGAVLLYNGAYTWMKRRTAFAAVPGAIIGVLGPAIGWVTGGGSPLSPTFLALATVFFLWQVPHFWLLNLNYPSDYETAGYPSPVARMGGDRLYRVGLMWIGCTAIATLSLPMFGLLNTVSLYLVVCLAAVVLYGVLLGAVRQSVIDAVRYRVSFAGVNAFVLITMILLIVESGL